MAALHSLVRAALVVAALVVIDASPAWAQVPVPPPPPTQTPPPRTPAPQTPQARSTREWRAVVLGGATFQPATTTFADRTDTPSFRETATVSSKYDVGDGAGLDVTGVVRVWRGVSIGAAVTHVSRSSSAVIDASYPHPFFFNRPRTASAELPDLARSETAVHLSAVYVVPSARRLRVLLFAGPSFFTVKQEVANRVDATDVYPFDTVTIATGTTTLKENVPGYHVGGDVTWYFSQHVGAGALVRLATASKRTSIHESSAFDLLVGGVQAGVGVRVRF